VLDAIPFEKQGIPAVAIVTHLFEETARAMASAWGVSGFGFLTMSHPVANLTNDQITERAEEAAKRVAEFLTRSASKNS